MRPSSTQRLVRTASVLGLAAAPLLWLGTLRGSDDPAPLQAAKPQVTITGVKFERHPNCRWTWVASAKSTDSQRVAVLARGFAEPATPAVSALKETAVLEPGASATLVVPARVFAWPAGVKTLRVDLEAGYSPAQTLPVVDTESVPIQRPPMPVAELKAPEVTLLANGTRQAKAFVTVAGADQAALDESEVKLRLCSAQSTPSFTCLADAQVSGMLIPAGCPTGPRFASVTRTIPSKATALKVIALLSGTGKPIGEKVFALK